jgi:hypothetical protein
MQPNRISRMSPRFLAISIGFAAIGATIGAEFWGGYGLLAGLIVGEAVAFGAGNLFKTTFGRSEDAFPQGPGRDDVFDTINTDEPPLCWPALVIGIGASALFVEIFDQSNLNGLLFIEWIFFLVASVVAFSFAPRNIVPAAAALLGGVFLGVLLNVLFHPHTATGFERNLFPFEAAFHTMMALPVLVVAAVLWKAVSVWRARHNSNGNGA